MCKDRASCKDMGLDWLLGHGLVEGPIALLTIRQRHDLLAGRATEARCRSISIVCQGKAEDLGAAV